MTFFDILRDRAKNQPAKIISRSNRRVVTNRKFWSRIERGTARLKGEWKVEPGDTVAYWGLGHQDALMLYLAAARCGARLLPLEHAPEQAASAAILRQIPVKVLLHDDELVFAPPPVVATLVNLSSLIATRCYLNPVIEEDVQCVSLLTLSGGEDGSFQVQEKSLQQLSSTGFDEAAQEFRVSAALFDNDVFAPQVLATLAAGGTIIFR